MYESVMRCMLTEMLADVLPPNIKIRDSHLLQAYATFEAMERNGNIDLSVAYKQVLSEKNVRCFLRGMSDVSTADLQNISEAFLQYPFKYFLRFAIPGFVGDVAALLQLFEQNGETSIPAMVHQIIQIKLIPFEMKKRGVKIADSDSVEGVLQTFYNVYCSIETNATTRFSKAKFLKFYRAINQYPLDFNELTVATLFGTEKKIKGMYRAIESLRDGLGMSKKRQIEFVNRFFVHNENDPKQVQQYEVYNFLKVKDREERIGTVGNAMASFAGSSPLECLCAISLSKRNRSGRQKTHKEDLVCENDVTLENGLVYSLFSSAVGSCDNDEPVAIFFPSPFFVRKWLRDPEMKKVPTTFVFKDENVAELLQYHYCSGEYEQNPGNEVAFLSYQQMLHQVHEGGQLPFSKGLLFACGWDTEVQSELYQTIKNYGVNSTEIFALISTAEFENAISPFSSELDDPHVSLETIALIPQGINNCSRPRRKLLLRCVVSSKEMSVEKKERVKIFSFTLNTDLKTQALSRLQEEPVEVAFVDLVSLHKSIRKLFKEELLKRRGPGRTNVNAVSYEFTPDISVWCSKSYPKDNRSRPRLQAYVCLPASREKVLRGYLDRGERIESTVKSASRITEDGILTWLENDYPFDHVRPRHTSSGKESKDGHVLKPTFSIREEVISAYAPILKEQDIAVKTFWYIHPDLVDTLTEIEYALFTQIVKTELGCLRFSELNVDQCESLLLRCFSDDNNEKLWARFKALSVAVDQAIKYGYCEENPLRIAVQDRTVRDRLFAQVRRALTKKHFMFEEMKKAYDETLKRIKEGNAEYIGVLIRMITGLESNVVCALRVKNFEENATYGFYCFSVISQSTNDGTAEKGFDRLEDYRIVPCMPVLSKVIKEHIAKIKELVPEYADVQNIPIVTTYKSVTKKSRYAFFAPKELDRLCKEIIKSVGIEDHIIEVPTHDGGTKETNLSNYGGNFFRENFRFCALNIAKMEPDEVQFLLGNKPDTTLGRYYIEFLDDGSQLNMYKKLRRWDLRLRKPVLLHGRLYEHHGKTSVTCKIPAEGQNPLRVCIGLKIKKGAGKIRLKVKGECGFKLFSAPLESPHEEV